MHKKLFNILLSLILACFSGAILAQSQNDTAKYDTSSVIVSWKLTDDFSKPKTIPVDTVLEDFEIIDPIDEGNKIFNNLGNTGSPAINHVFYKRPHVADFFLVNSSLPYLSTYENTIFYNTRHPFTSMHYTTGVVTDANKEEMLHVIHTQNITPTLNIGGDYHLINSRGFYNYQPVRKNSGRLFGSYLGEKYSLYTSINVNKHEIAENGGIAHVDSVLHNNDLNPDDMVTNIPGADGANALTPNAKNTLKTRNIFLMQKYRLHQEDKLSDSIVQNKALFNLEFAHLFKYDVFAKYYEDNLGADFYENQYVNQFETKDSLISRKLSNTLRVEFNEVRKYNVAVRADLTYEIKHNHYYLYNDDDQNIKDSLRYAIDIDSDQANEQIEEFLGLDFIRNQRYANLYTSVALYNKIPRKWDWIVNGDYYLAGYNFGDFNLYGEVDRTFGRDSLISLNLSGNYSLKNPSPIYANFYSNQFRWTDLSYQKVNIFTLSGRLGLPKFNAYVQYTQSNLYNYVYLNENAQPEQIGRLVSINALEFSHKIDRGIFRTEEYAILQQSSDESIIDLPLVSLKAKIYVAFPMLFKSTGGRLDHIIGLSVRYNTEYYANAYMPALMSYYKQRNTRVGNYPYVDAFWNIKLKQVRFLLKYEHINYGLMARNIQLVPDYPQSPGVFKVGIAWTFYN